MKSIAKARLGFELAVLICAACLQAKGDVTAASSQTDSSSSEQSTFSRPLSTNATEVVQLAESGVEDEITLAYIECSQTPFELSADDIVYLKDLGIEVSIITAMLHQDAVLREEHLQLGTAATNQFVFDQKLYQPAANVSAPTPQTVYVTNAPTQVTYFYDSLAPYGTWIDLEGYGWCWQPQVVVIDRNWHPYWQGGRWIYTDSGWYWGSDYSWGWAPFHYGRWHHHDRHGWVWFPDLVWAPAWVSWRFSDTHCGWAPLPFGANFVIGHGWRFINVSVGADFDFHLGLDLFTFVELRHLQERHPHLHAVPAAQVREIHNHTTVVNNYAAGPNNRIMNQGISASRVAAATGRELHPVMIRDKPAAGDRSIKRDHISNEGSERVIYRPELKPPVRPVPVTAQKVGERQTIVRARPELPSLLGPTRSSGAVRSGAPYPVSPASKSVQSPAGTRAPNSRGTWEPGKRPETKPITPRPIVPQSTQRGNAPVPSVHPRSSTASPPRFESPRGREQRLSNGARMQQPWASPPRAPSSPTPQGTSRGQQKLTPP